MKTKRVKEDERKNRTEEEEKEIREIKRQQSAFQNFKKL